MLDWYVTDRSAATAAVREISVKRWRDALLPAVASPPTWVLRDYHSPNLLWLPNRDGIARIRSSISDALLGPAAYDVASLLQDARASTFLKMKWPCSADSRARRKTDQNFNAVTFAQLSATLPAQRATKILGVLYSSTGRRAQYVATSASENICGGLEHPYTRIAQDLVCRPCADRGYAMMMRNQVIPSRATR